MLDGYLEFWRLRALREGLVAGLAAVQADGQSPAVETVMYVAKGLGLDVATVAKEIADAWRGLPVTPDPHTQQRPRWRYGRGRCR